MIIVFWIIFVLVTLILTVIVAFSETNLEYRNGPAGEKGPVGAEGFKGNTGAMGDPGLILEGKIPVALSDPMIPEVAYQNPGVWYQLIATPDLLQKYSILITYSTRAGYAEEQNLTLIQSLTSNPKPINQPTQVIYNAGEQIRRKAIVSNGNTIWSEWQII